MMISSRMKKEEVEVEGKRKRQVMRKVLERKREERVGQRMMTWICQMKMKQHLKEEGVR